MSKVKSLIFHDKGLRESMDITARSGGIVDQRQEMPGVRNSNSFNFKDTVLAKAGITYKENKELVN